MNFVELFKKENSKFLKEYEECIEKVQLIKDDKSVEGQLRNYFLEVSDFILNLKRITDNVESGDIEKMSLEEIKDLNKDIFKDILLENYDMSFANPSFAVSTLGKECGEALSLIYTKLRDRIEDAFSYKIFNMVSPIKLFVNVYEVLSKDEKSLEEVKSIITKDAYDEDSLKTELYLRRYFDTSLNYSGHIIKNSDLNDLRYLYKYDSYITEREVKIAEFFKNLSQKKIDDMVNTYVSGYVRGYELAKLDLKSKKYVNIYYSIGFERMAKYAGIEFEKIGLTPIYTLYQEYFTNRQYKYDHRYDYGIYFTDEYTQMRMKNLKEISEKYSDELGLYAGPAAIETFGEETFEPKNKEEAISLTKEQLKLDSKFKREFGITISKALKRSETSFTIIAYPTPDIGEDFEAIFNETVKLNNLDNKLYAEIQQTIIDALDKGDYVHVLGMGENKTDLKVNLYKLKDPEKETIFENCTADVNIPVGEVFTSPVLKDTNGKLHVTEVFLNGLQYKDLEIDLKDGMIDKYTCKNFDKEEDNLKFVKENILFNHETVPIGEFAIGTNTTAYVMGQKYNIQGKLPILIAEKTGPHFAMGDTCYSMSEDHKVYNPNGKEIVARDNECSILRKTDMEKAYFNCHTDITIPYDELGEISVYNKKGEKTVIIKDGRFVLPGTEKLNEAFEK
ncbi:MAG: aminopeptidase [Clostridium sp.]|uniref:aminopeptidase n=1 Tax=Clostridium sp. DSM 8431 TaxID=1761781 RepID=UPI0008EABB9A|nr:aminopeptidase [Clostridium sp. DSM 8431]MCR4942881.1 aminopeptidase [Clostridium sp.]SFU85444.1 Thermophilic metalloprotease (M29) [Clostridium sp. DSM 8431]